MISSLRRVLKFHFNKLCQNVVDLDHYKEKVFKGELLLFYTSDAAKCDIQAKRRRIWFLEFLIKSKIQSFRRTGNY